MITWYVHTPFINKRLLWYIKVRVLGSRSQHSAYRARRLRRTQERLRHRSDEQADT